VLPAFFDAPEQLLPSEPIPTSVICEYDSGDDTANFLIDFDVEMDTTVSPIKWDFSFAFNIEAGTIKSLTWNTPYQFNIEIQDVMPAPSTFELELVNPSSNFASIAGLNVPLFSETGNVVSV